MLDEKTLNDFSRETLRKRRELGERCAVLAWRGPWSQVERVTNEEDRETAAKDAISDILTAIVGPAGHVEVVPRENGDGETWRRVPSPTQLAAARSLVNAALQSWEGDLEDYSVE